MQDHHSFFRRFFFLPVIAMSLFAGGTLKAAVSFTVTPSTVDAASLAPVTLQITGLSAGAAVQIQKYVDFNGNGVIDASEPMIQSFVVTDNHALSFGGVTDTAVPGDSNLASGAITVALNAANNGLTPYISGKFIYKVSSLSGTSFTPITKSFTVNNTANAGYGTVTGHVSYNGATVSNAFVIVFSPPGGNNGYSSVGGGTAGPGGNFTVKVPPGKYVVGAFASNYLAHAGAAPIITVTAGQTITNNPLLVKANQNLTGKVYDTNSGAGFAGFAVFCQSTNGYAALGFTASSGAFTVPVNSGYWKISANERALGMRGYLSPQNSKKVVLTGSGATVNIAVPKADAMIFGRILDNNGNPVAGVDMYANDDQGNYETEGLTDVNGYYYLGASSSSGNWNVGINSPQAAQIQYDYTGGYNSTNLSSGSSAEEDFGAVAAPYTITGYLDDSTNGTMVAIEGVDVSAYAVINGTNYQTASCETDANGHYSINVAGNTTWTVQVADVYGDNGGLIGLGYSSVDSQNVNIASSNGVANFVVPPDGYQELDGNVMDANGNPIAGVEVDGIATNYPNVSATTDANGYYELFVGNGTWDVSVNCTDLASLGYTNCPSDQQVGVGFGNAGGIDFVVQGVLSTAPAPFFTGQVALSGGWYYLGGRGGDTDAFGY